MRHFLRIIFLLVSTCYLHRSAYGDFTAQLGEAKSQASAIVNTLWERWQIEKFPNFLASAAMSPTSWEVLKLKFQYRILSIQANKSTDETFVISFMGSSVTAGHDSNFNDSFPVLVEDELSPAFRPLNIRLETRNAAMGNNPCMPYDICVKTFSGSDADIIHWEQSYNCMSNSHAVLEQFVRQASTLPRRPVVVFSDSATPNWKENDCKNIRKFTLTEQEVNLLAAWKKKAPLEIVSSLNKREVVFKWKTLSESKDILKAYKIVGIQLFQHSAYEKYKCFGPYIKNWGCCSASWHPSLLGHQLRAAHYSFFWLLIFIDSISDLEAKFALGISVDTILAQIMRRVENEAKFIPKKALYESKVSDEMQCFTNFEPRNEPGQDLVSRVVSGMQKSGSERGWKYDVFENFINPNTHRNAREQGYLDVKYMLYGNKDDGPLSLSIEAKRAGHLFICQAPGEWGKLPKGFINIWDAKTRVYLNPGISAVAATAVNGTYDFDPEKSKNIEYRHETPKGQDICVVSVNPIPKGTHILTVLPVDPLNIIVSVLLIP